MQDIKVRYEYTVKIAAVVAKEMGTGYSGPIAYISSGVGQFGCKYNNPVHFMTQANPRLRFSSSTKLLEIILSGVFV